MPTDFLSVPLKTTKEVDLYKPLKGYIDQHLRRKSKSLWAEVDKGLVELNKLRHRACCQPLDKHESALDVLTRYYDQLSAMETKLPITKTQNPICFKWYNAFGGGLLSYSDHITLNDSSLERASVLFNCGALMSAIATTQQLHTDEELKTMARLFQQAAGVFSRLKDTVLALVVQQEPTSDLLPDTLTVLVALMVAQAQEAIYIKAAKDRLKAASLLKIAAQCADFYQDTQKLMNRDSVKRIWEREWTQTVTGKGLVYAALAQMHAAEVAMDAQKYGEQVSRLREANKLMDQSNACLPSAFTEQRIHMRKELDRATKDNDFIYHEGVPDIKKLPPLPKAALAKPNVTFPLNAQFKDLFPSDFDSVLQTESQNCSIS